MRKQIHQSSAKRIAWLVSLGIDKITDRGLTAAHLFSDLWLRHLSVTLDFGYYVFPVHAPIITAFRYSSNVFSLSVFHIL